MPLHFPTAVRIRWSAEIFRKPFLFLVFLYFLTLSADLLSIPLLPFTIKLTNFIGIAAFISYLVFYRGKLAISQQFLLVAIGCIASLLLSTLLGYNRFACLGFILFFVFNYFIYFVFPSNIFCVINENTVFRIYFLSFICIGCYAAAQVIFSVFGIMLPYVGQTMLGDRIARGGGLSYEPSYYALYMTPYAIFQTTQYLLQDSKERSARTMLLSNFLLIISTSSGCFFSYIAFIVLFCSAKAIKRIRKFSSLKVLYRFFLCTVGVTLILLCINPDLIYNMFFKFFFMGFTTHGSFMERWTMLVVYWLIFLENFWTGTGLGGASTFLLLQQGVSQIDVLDPATLRTPFLIATNVTTELLASVGIIGAICFGFLFWAIWKKFQNAYRIPNLEQIDRIRLTAFALSLCVTFFTLQFNQSIMRCYIWVHVGMSMGYIQHLRFKYAKQREKTESLPDLLGSVTTHEN